MNVCIFGSGEHADALAILCTRAGATLTDRLDVADLVVLANPAETLRAEVRSLGLGPAARVLVATRGLEPVSGKRLSNVVIEESACLRVGVLGGPIVPAEVKRHSPCAGVVSSAFDEVNRLGVTAFHSALCRIYPTRGLAEVELAGALVEVLTVALGVAHGMGLGVGAQAMLVTRGTAEGMRLMRAEGGDPQTFAGLAGLGELVACAGLPDHTARRRGLALAEGAADPALVSRCEALLRRCRDLPITEAIGALAAGKLKASAALAALLQRDVRAEGER